MQVHGLEMWYQHGQKRVKLYREKEIHNEYFININRLKKNLLSFLTLMLNFTRKKRESILHIYMYEGHLESNAHSFI